MFSTLLESKGTRKAHSRWLPVSAVIHVALLGAAVTQSRPAQGREPDVHETPTITWIAPQTPELNSEPASGGGGGAAAERAQPERRIPDFDAAPIVDLPDLTTSPAAPMTDIGARLIHTAPVGRAGAPGSSSGDANGPRWAAQVEKVALPLPGNAVPTYPAVLRSAGIEGGVTLRFVIDTTGAVERGSETVIRSDHALFTAAALRALATHRFLPAEAGGTRVRMLVEQRFEFALGGS